MSESQAVTPAEREEEWLMLGLRTVWGLDAAEYESRFRHPFTPFLSFLEKCRQAGLARPEDGRWRLTPQGFLVSNQIIGEILSVRDREFSCGSTVPNP